MKHLCKSACTNTYELSVFPIKNIPDRDRGRQGQVVRVWRSQQNMGVPGLP